uniref:Uncharacterized protein n=1 Tax=Physcomitrium patens TaxID=3218 RepID=A0A2K1IVP6_PHYPA|nr:hypothetical protein PHYPA_025293 [Physcomitrium patens]
MAEPTSSLATNIRRQGTLTLVSNRTVEKDEVVISAGEKVRAIDLRIMRGYLNTTPVHSTLSYIRGDEGTMWDRGYPI